jgi:hypothetical protein
MWFMDYMIKCGLGITQATMNYGFHDRRRAGRRPIQAYLRRLLDHRTELVIKFLVLRVESEFIRVGRNVVGSEHKVCGLPPHKSTGYYKVFFLTLITE